MFFLDTYAFYNNVQNIFDNGEPNLPDVTKFYGYTELVADKFKDVPVI